MTTYKINDVIAKAWGKYSAENGVFAGTAEQFLD